MGFNIMSPDYQRNIKVSISGVKRYYQRYFAPSTKVSEVKKDILSWRSVIRGGDHFDLKFKGTVVDCDLFLSEYNGEEFCVEFQIKPKEGYFLVKFTEEKVSCIPCFALMTGNPSLLDLKKLLLEDWLIKVGVCHLNYKDKGVLEDTDMLRNFSPEGDTVELGYWLIWDGNLIYVKTLTGKVLYCIIRFWHEVELLKLQIEEKEGIPPDQQRFIYACKQLEDGRTISDYCMRREARLDLVLRLRGGGGPGMQFADITKEEKAKSFEWSKSGAPDWRMARKGLCLEGKCLNERCRAYGRWVIINKGVGTYDVVYDHYQNRCPMCWAYVKAENVL